MSNERVSDEQLAELFAWFDDERPWSRYRTPEGPTVKGQQVTAALRELHALRAERDALRELMLDMRQHQGAIQPYIKRMDAALAAQERKP